MGFLSSISSIGSAINGSINLETEAKKTKNYDKYNQEIKVTSNLIAEKGLAVENLLKQKDFASLKQKLEQYKQQKGI
jgi:hypothetical protein